LSRGIDVQLASYSHIHTYIHTDPAHQTNNTPPHTHTHPPQLIQPQPTTQVKYFGNETHEADRYDASLTEYQRAALKTQTSLSLLNAGQNAIFSAGLSAIMVGCWGRWGGVLFSGGGRWCAEWGRPTHVSRFPNQIHTLTHTRMCT
jgi:hypothetical protein